MNAHQGTFNTNDMTGVANNQMLLSKLLIAKLY
ncbi:hypothetical protein CODIS_14400 [Candidatus Thiodiazotropha endolucinida]|uniref:Uncharacterized protein n=1 Tax=Candidatus Thiodiazotropha endolucinida TaxID=1655433 RepID=A0A7Z0VN00_9GAMM|nr:hypothetical protein CODIS_14400 [Candidatus Thiodiazotropha endolucinida]